jgi:toxin CptA
MMSQGFEPSLLLELKPSRRLIKMLVFAHVLALVAITANALAWFVKAGLCVGVCTSGWLTVKQVNARHYAIRQSDALGWQLTEGTDWLPIDILQSTVITRFALFLHFKHSFHTQSWLFNREKAWLILSDALAEEDYRWLIVKVKTTAIK